MYDTAAQRQAGGKGNTGSPVYDSAAQQRAAGAIAPAEAAYVRGRAPQRAALWSADSAHTLPDIASPMRGVDTQLLLRYERLNSWLTPALLKSAYTT